ncbi:DUF3224 domain-containing protein [Pengzhenrongella sp.]|jgi:hypothetical protein|uniref:DUF3224 domain-containing protein n=1 Tax=Pengzhenrongella sp. TaxID=2888820 RepID=UPI002F95B530
MRVIVGRVAFLQDRAGRAFDAGYTYSGEVEGTSTLVYLIAYKADAAPVLGLEQFTGTIGGQDGTCVLRQLGSQDAGSVSAHLEVVPGMGTGGLESLTGEAELVIANHCDDGYDLVLHYDLGSGPGFGSMCSFDAHIVPKTGSTGRAQGPVTV